MLGPLISILVFGFVAVTATRMCTAKDWPLSVGLTIGIGGQIVGRIAMSIVAGVLIANESPLGILFLLVPILGMLFPLLLAWMLPHHRNRKQEWLDSHPHCSRCGAPTAVFTPICDKCTT